MLTCKGFDISKYVALSPWGGKIQNPIELSHFKSLSHTYQSVVQPSLFPQLPFLLADPATDCVDSVVKGAPSSAENLDRQGYATGAVLVKAPAWPQ
jgi:hypothetical protein